MVEAKLGLANRRLSAGQEDFFLPSTTVLVAAGAFHQFAFRSQPELLVSTVRTAVLFPDVMRALANATISDVLRPLRDFSKASISSSRSSKSRCRVVRL